MEGDICAFTFNFSIFISIHSLRMEGDDVTVSLCERFHGFQSTPSAWRETESERQASISIYDFNPLPPHGGRPTFLYPVTTGILFQSTPSAWRETSGIVVTLVAFCISIHSLRMEGDIYHSLFRKNAAYFNPLPPHGGRHRIGQEKPCFYYFNPLPPHGGRLEHFKQHYRWYKFQSTPSAWRETQFSLETG